MSKTSWLLPVFVGLGLVAILAQSGSPSLGSQLLPNALVCLYAFLAALSARQERSDEVWTEAADSIYWLSFVYMLTMISYLLAGGRLAEIIQGEDRVTVLASVTKHLGFSLSITITGIVLRHMLVSTRRMGLGAVSPGPATPGDARVDSADLALAHRRMAAFMTEVREGHGNFKEIMAGQGKIMAETAAALRKVSEENTKAMKGLVDEAAQLAPIFRKSSEVIESFSSAFGLKQVAEDAEQFRKNMRAVDTAFGDFLRLLEKHVGGDSERAWHT